MVDLILSSEKLERPDTYKALEPAQIYWKRSRLWLKQYLKLLEGLRDNARDWDGAFRPRVTDRARSKKSIDEHGLCSESKRTAVEDVNDQ